MTIHEEIIKTKDALFRDNEIVVVFDIDPITVGHILILSVKRYLDIDEIPTELLSTIFDTANHYLNVLIKFYPYRGYTIMQNGGVYNDLDVFHLHVIPRMAESELNFVTNNDSNRIIITEIKELFRADVLNYG